MKRPLLNEASACFLFFALFLFTLFPDTAANASTPSAVAEKLVKGGREEVARRPFYRSKYHKGGYPPAGEGVCTDLIWRAFKVAGFNLKAMIDEDIRKSPDSYHRVNKPDPNIDFRRVPNQAVYFKRHAENLSIKIAPGNKKLMEGWLPGDIVVFRNPDHIAILSDKRNDDFIPYLIHNQGPWATEGDDFMAWHRRGIVARFRWN